MKTNLHWIWLFPLMLFVIVINLPYRIMEWFMKGQLIKMWLKLCDEYLPKEGSDVKCKTK